MNHHLPRTCFESKGTKTTRQSTTVPADLKIYGKFKKNQVSSVKSDLLSRPKQVSSEPAKQRVSSSGTVISAIIDKQQTGNSKFPSTVRSLNLTQPLKDGLVFAIILPFILDEEKGEVKQPILIKIQESELEEFGFSLPFSSFQDRKMNCFKMKIDIYHFCAQIIAIGDSPLNLKVCLQENVSSNPEWKDLPKMKRLCDGVTSLHHCPLESDSDIPVQRVLSKQEISKLFSRGDKATEYQEQHRETQENDKEENENSADHNKPEFESDNDNSLNSDEDSTPTVLEGDQGSNINDRRSEKKTKAVQEEMSKSKRRKKDSDLMDKSVMDVAMNSINDQVDDLMKRQKSLSEYDTVGSYLISIIHVLDEVRQYIDLKNQYKAEISNSVPEKDLTYKNTQKNRIYIEGVIRLDLDLYDEAIRNSTPSKAPSFAYQLIKIAFPKAYYERVTLGKKVMGAKEVESYLSIDENCEKTKYPLSFIWGFEKPYSSRMEGKFNYKLGQQRLRAFINHCFRKAKIFEYSAAAEYSVRARIIKELCSKNTNLNKESKISEPEDEANDPRFNNLNHSFSDIWDLNAFES